MKESRRSRARRRELLDTKSRDSVSDEENSRRAPR